MSILLPGLYTCIAGYMLFYITNNFFIDTSTGFLSLITAKDFVGALLLFMVICIAGSIINGISFYLIEGKYSKHYQQHTGMYIGAATLVTKSPSLKPIILFLNNDCNTLFGKSYLPTTEAANKTIQENYFDYVFYYLSVHNCKEDTLREQSFYFLYRHLFNANLILAIIAIITSSYLCFSNSTNLVLVLSFLAFILALNYCFFAPLAIWHRKRMITRMFYQYYIHKTTILNKQ